MDFEKINRQECPRFCNLRLQPIAKVGECPSSGKIGWAGKTAQYLSLTNCFIALSFYALLL
ncbi:hypothetical protein B6N25_13025 [Sphingobacteriales bacterium TSM_CSS]|nr:hypothetical protein B6N25_13025 [Sphingobacteriales bacterium TSM_CSS]